MAYAMASATHEDMKIVRRHVSDEDFREALDRAPPRYHRPTLLGLLERENGTLPYAAVAAAHVRMKRVPRGRLTRRRYSQD